MHSEPRRFSTYEETLFEFLREELEGETYFARLAEVFQGEQRQAFRLLSRMETVCVRAFDPVIERLDLDGPNIEEAHAMGRAQAEKRKDESWNDHLDEMAHEFDVYLDEFRIGAAQGPAERGLRPSESVRLGVPGGPVVHLARRAPALSPLVDFLKNYEAD